MIKRNRNAEPVREEADHSISRRKLLKLSPLILFAGCDYSAGKRTTGLLLKFQKFNDWLQSKVFDINRPVPEYADADMTPEDHFRVNGYDTDEPEIDMEHWALEVSGLVSKPGKYTLDQIKSLPKYVMNTRHVCVEGWSMIPKWGGARMKDFLEMIGADKNAEYVSVKCGDDYYCCYDMPSLMHAQTLVCYEAYNKPLTLKHGAPARIVVPTKLGYKQSKWLMELVVTNEKPGGYWEDQGYDWFGGI